MTSHSFMGLEAKRAWKWSSSASIGMSCVTERCKSPGALGGALVFISFVDKLRVNVVIAVVPIHSTNWRRGQRVRPYLSRCRLDSYNHRPDGFLDTQGRCLARKCRDLMVFKLFLSATKCSIDLYFSFTRISVCFTWIFVRQYRDVLEAMRF